MTSASAHVPRRVPLELLLGALTAFGPLSIDMYLPALPTIARNLGSTMPAVQMTLASYFVGLSLAQLITGPLIDRFGRTRPLYVGLALYVLGSLGCAVAPSVEALVAFRFVQALGGAVGIVVPRAVVRDLHAGAAAAKVMSRLVLVMGAAPILAPLAGGFILAHAGWRALFFVLAAAGSLALLAVWRWLPETAPELTGPQRPFTQLAALVRAPDFIGPTLAVAFAFAGMFAYISGSPHLFINLHHIPAERFGLFFGANALGYVTASQINHRLLSRYTPSQVLSTALKVSLVAGIAVLVAVLTGFGGVWGVWGALFSFMASLGFIGPNATAVALEHHRTRAGMGSALMGGLQSIIAASAAGMVGALFDGTARPLAFVLLTAIGLAGLAWAVGSRLAVRAGTAGPARDELPA